MAIKDTDLVWVQNRNNGVTSYTLSDRNIKRTWNANERKQIPFDELRAFSYTPGAEYALKNLLIVEDDEALKALSIAVEPEYYYTPEKIADILFKGDLDDLADFLDFAPEGAIDIAKDIAIQKQLPDVRKREMISDKTGVNINNAIMVNKIMDEDAPAKVEEDKKTRRKAVTEEAKPAPTRRKTSEYKIVKMEADNR